MKDAMKQNRRTFLKLGAALGLGSLPFVARAASDTERKLKIGIVGSGRIGGTLGGIWLKAGHEVMFSSRDLEHDWVAEEGSYIFEPPGETHTLVVPEGCTEMVTLFQVTGSLMYVDPQGVSTGYDDVFTRLEKARAHYGAVGLGDQYVDQFIR